MSEARLSRRPYLIRAIVDWVVDCGDTPLLLVDAEQPGVQVPEQFIDEEGRIVLNVSADAVQALELGNSLIRFRARFGGRPHLISLPPAAVLAVYARETGDGMLLGDAEAVSEPPEDDPSPDGPPRQPSKPSDDKSSRRAHLKVVK
ncbi:MAG: ClpXP protease specificity-enhancing factor [Salinisphaeraceae bacterium]|nr:ClpXP protease specificity-enhancing factor [Salinisphaeraceae bacterium]